MTVLILVELNEINFDLVRRYRDEGAEPTSSDAAYAASLTPAMKRRLEAQSQLIEQDLASERRVIEHQNPKGEGDEQPRQTKLKSA